MLCLYQQFQRNVIVKCDAAYVKLKLCTVRLEYFKFLRCLPSPSGQGRCFISSHDILRESAVNLQPAKVRRTMIVP